MLYPTNCWNKTETVSLPVQEVKAPPAAAAIARAKGKEEEDSSEEEESDEDESDEDDKSKKVAAAAAAKKTAPSAKVVPFAQVFFCIRNMANSITSLCAEGGGV